MTEEIQKNLKKQMDKHKQLQKDYTKALLQSEQLNAQLHENIGVKKELDCLKAEDDVFKLIGPVLIKQDLEEAKQNVAKRMEYISSELKRVEEIITSLEKKQDTSRETLQKYQQAILKASLSQPKA